MAENSRKCFKCGRSPSVNPDTKLFRFPKPGITNILRCELWAKYCFPDGKWSSQEFQHKLHREHKMLCERHFKRTSFSDYPLSTKKLHRFAVPNDEEGSAAIVFVPQPMLSSAEPLQDRTNIIFGENQKIIPNIPEANNTPERKGQLLNEQVASASVRVPQPLPSSLCPLQDRTNIKSGDKQMKTNVLDCVLEGNKVLVRKKQIPDGQVIAAPAFVPQQGQSSSRSLQKPSEDQPISYKKSEKKTEREKYLYNKCRKHMKKICQLRTRLNKLKNKTYLQEISKNESINELIKKLSPTFALLLQAQIKNFTKKSKGRRWTREEKITALRLYKRSPTCYRLMRRLFCLPSPSSLKALLGEFELSVGINNNIFSVLKKFTKKQKPSDNEYVLMFDEMSIKKNLNYNKKTDMIDGYQDHGQQGRSPQLASHALVFMVAGIRKKVKQPVAFYLSSGFVTADRLAVLIKEVIRECIQAGLNIAATVCDMDGVNRRALGILGATVEKPCIRVDNVEIISIFDPPHLLKCFRNLLMKYDMKCKTQITSNQKSGEGVAKWSHIVKFHELDSSNPNFVFAPALKSEHLNPNTKQKMKVKLAAQVFSHTVAAGMMAKISQGELSTEAITTVNVIENMDKLFDTLNSDTPDLRRGKIFATNMKNTTPHLQFLSEMKAFFNSVEFVGCYRPPPSKEGWIWTLNAIEQLWKKITNKHKDVKSLATRRLQQDPLENLFGCIRGNCGSNTNPTTGQFIAGLKTAILSNLANLSRGNCETDTFEVIIDNYKMLLTKQPTNICTETLSVQLESTNFPNSSDLPSTSHLSEEFGIFCDSIIEDEPSGENGEIQACAYVCGFLLKNIKTSNCENCKNIFFAKGKSQEHLFLECREYEQSKNKLNYCTIFFLNYVENCATEINKTIKNIGYEKNIKSKVLNKLQCVNSNFLKECPQHFSINERYITESVFYICIKRYCILRNRAFQEEASKLALMKKINILKHK